MLVDEYQDSNVAQYLWLRLLAQGNGNICCVGDDDQSIYGWRGAEVDNILRFETDFPGAKIIRLERNYRSTGHILGAASGLIAHNKGRLGKTLRTDGDLGEQVEIEGCWDDEEEARVIGEDIEQLQRQGHALSEIAILVRASFQMRAFEDRFITLGLPYRVIGGPRFYERQEIKDATAYFEVTLNPANDLKFERIVNTPRRGLGESSLKSLHQLARAQGVPLFQAARLIVETEELKPKARKSLADLIAAFDRWRSLIDTMRHTELAELILDEFGYTAMWQAERSPQAQSKLENLKELIRFMEEFDTLAGFLEHVSPGDGRADRRRRRPRQPDDAAFRQGARIRHRVPARLGRRAAAASAQPRRSGPLRPRRRAAARSCRADAGAASAPRSPSRRTAGTTARGRRRSPPASSTSCRSTISSSPRTKACAATGRAGSTRAETLFASGFYETPGWQRAQRNRPRGSGTRRRSREPMTIDGTLVAASTAEGAGLAIGDARVPPEIRLWPRGAGRRQQAHGRFRQGRAEEGGRQLRRAGVKAPMRCCVVLAVAMTGLAPVAGAEPLWTVEAAQIAYLVYGEPGKPVLSISCGQEEGETGRDETRIEVEVEKGNKPGKDKVVLRVDEDKGHQAVPLTPLICGGSSECQNPAGRRGLSLRDERTEQGSCGRHRQQGENAVDRCARRQDHRAGGPGRLQEILGQLPELVSAAGSSLVRTKRVHWRRRNRGRWVMRALAISAMIMISFAFLCSARRPRRPSPKRSAAAKAAAAKAAQAGAALTGFASRTAKLAEICGTPAGTPCKQEAAARVCFGKQS